MAQMHEEGVCPSLMAWKQTVSRGLPACNGVGHILRRDDDGPAPCLRNVATHASSTGMLPPIVE